MSYKVYARHGGAVAASLDDITARVPALDEAQPIIQLGMSFQNGGASQGSLIVPDPIGNMDDSLYFPPRTLIRWTEDASGDELWLAQGRVSAYSIGRPDYRPPAASVEWNLTVDDANVDLRGLAFTEDWVRPAETGTARLYALALYTLNGTSSTRPNYGSPVPSITYRPSTTIIASSSHLAPDTNTTVMPAKTYPIDTQPTDVLGDIASTEGKVYGVVLHHTGGSSHLCLLYILETDHSTYASTCKISDDPADWDPEDLTAPVFVPIYDQGDAQRVDGNAFISGVVSRFGAGADQIEVLLDTTAADATEYWVESYQDGDSTEPLQAQARAASIIAYRGPYAETDSVSIVALAAQTHLLTAGMSIQVKAAPINTSNDSSIGSYLDRRIVSLQWEPMPDGRYHGILQLNKGIRGGGGGASQPVSTTPRPAPQCLPPDDPTVVYDFDDGIWPGSYPVTVACGSGYTSMGASGGDTPAFPVVAESGYDLHLDINGTWHDYIVRIELYDLDPGGPGVSLGITEHDLGVVANNACASFDITFATPGATYARIEFAGKLGGWRYKPHLDLLPAIAAEDDPFCVDYDGLGLPHDSPYFKPSDTVQFEIAELNEQISSLSTSTISIKHLLTANPFPICAHRGDIGNDGDAGTSQPENTLEAIRQAVKKGANLVEFDLIRDSDGVWQLMHDATVTRTTDGSGNVSSKTTAQMAALNIDGGYGYNASRHGTSLNVPTLDDILDVLRPYDVGVYFHLKETTAEAGTVLAQKIEDEGFVARGIVLCDGGADQAAAVKAVALSLETAVLSGVLTDVENELDIERLLARQDHPTSASVVNGHFPKPTDQYFEVSTNYGVDETAAIEDAFEFGVRILMTNYLDTALTVRERIVEKSATLDSTSKVPTDQLGTGTPSATTFLRGDRTWDVAVVSETTVRDIGHWEVVVSGTAPPVATTNGAEDDWVYGWLSG